MRSDSSQDFEALLDYLKRSRGFDFTGYKRASLMRRVKRQMDAAEIESYSDYTSLLESDPDEARRLLNTILINVTAFFRDIEAWDALKTLVLPQIIDGKPAHEQIRIWSAGCAAGEEAYTIAMILAEALGPDAFRDRVRVHATDLDEDALAYARQAVYTERQVAGVPPELLSRYFDMIGGRFALDRGLRHAVIFGRHDLVQDVPISRLDLIVCRNTLMYFNSDVQARILPRFHFGLNNGGYLFLGKAEMFVARTSLFVPVDLKRRILCKIPALLGRNRMYYAPVDQDEEAADRITSGTFAEAAFRVSTLAKVVVDRNGCVALMSDRASLLFRLNPHDLGRPFQDLELSYRPVELRSSIEKVYADGHAVQLKNIVWTRPRGERSTYDVQVTPLSNRGGNLSGVCIEFVEVTDYVNLQAELATANRELSLTFEESQSATEELETANEELQSSAEELETTNEELQSTNEELETMNEELQSANEELQTMNEELRQRGLQLSIVSEFTDSIMASIPGGLIVIGEDLKVQAWNHRAEEMWGMRTDEVVGNSFFGLDIGLPVAQLSEQMKDCLEGGSALHEATMSATNRRGKAVNCKVSCMPVVNKDGAIRGVMIITQEIPVPKPTGDLATRT